MNALRAVALALLSAAPLAAGGAEGSYGVGYAALTRRAPAGGARAEGGVALEARVEDRVLPGVGLGLTFTWVLADWARAREYVDAGNRAGAWTTEKLAQVERWARKKPSDPSKDTRPLKFLGLAFADLFLLATYAAVPACYAGSVGGATSALQVDVAGSFHLLERGRTGVFVEAGLGAATLPYRWLDTWRGVVGPVAGVGVRVGPVRLGARGLWSPPALNHARGGGTVTTAAVTVGLHP